MLLSEQNLNDLQMSIIFTKEKRGKGKRDNQSGKESNRIEYKSIYNFLRYKEVIKRKTKRSKNVIVHFFFLTLKHEKSEIDHILIVLSPDDVARTGSTGEN